MPSSEKMSAVTGRQYVAAAKVPLAFADLPTAGDYLVTDLPEGAVVTSGWVYTTEAFDATATLTLTVADAADTTIDTLSGALDVTAVGKDDLAPTGVELPSAGEVKVTTSIDLTQGAGYLYLEYVVDGRSHFSEG